MPLFFNKKCMKQLLEKKKMVEAVLPQQHSDFENGRFSWFTISIPCEDEILLYNTLTGELLLLNEDEIHAPAVEAELKRKWFLVPETFDEKHTADQIMHVSRLLVKKPKDIKTFCVYTTTECNARCSYCYEKGRRSIRMTSQTAKDVAAFIRKKNKSGDVKLHWFGGEPLYNETVIDIICSELIKHDIKITSEMTSNGYLFDKGTVGRAAKEWNLQSIQITLDGTEEVYNKTKSFIYKTENAYHRVMRNIDLLLDEGINVVLRLSVDKNNSNDLLELIDELKIRYNSNQLLSVYPALITSQEKEMAAVDIPEEYQKNYSIVKDAVLKAGLGSVKFLRREQKVNQCMADNDYCITIRPDGMIGKCIGEDEDDLIGSIYDDSLNQEKINKWKKRIIQKECNTCLHYPGCTKLENCPLLRSTGCTQSGRTMMTAALKNQIIEEYKRWRSK